MPQSQNHGFIWENHVRGVFGLEAVSNDRNIHDIPCNNNKFNSNENISIKCSGGTKVECGDIMHLYNYNFNETNTIIVIRWEQNTDTTKKIKCMYEIDYNKELHKILFGTITKNIIKEYVEFITSIPPGKEAQQQSKQEREERKKKLQKIHNMKAVIHPKVDSKKQRRVQCSFNINNIPSDYIKTTSSKETPNLLKYGDIPLTIESSRRKMRGGITIAKLNNICRVNKDVCRGFSKHTKKDSLIGFLKERNLGHIIEMYTHI